MKPDIKKKWLEALRSGEYKQGQSYLHINSKFCCLGVLCDLHRKETNQGDWSPHGSSNVFTYLNISSTLPEEVQEWSGMKNGYGYYTDGHDKLTSDNDNGKTFLEIADIIEKHF